MVVVVEGARALRLFSDTQEVPEAEEDVVDSDCGESMLMNMSAGRMCCRRRCGPRRSGAGVGGAASAGRITDFSDGNAKFGGGGESRWDIVAFC